MSFKPWQNKWICRNCGRMFTLKQIGVINNPTCYFCGPQYPLSPWMESANWTFFVFGLIGLPTVGHYLSKVSEMVGLTSTHIKQACFFLVPTLLLILDVPAYLSGRIKRNRMIKRGGEQGLLMVLGFIACVIILLATGYYWKIIGIQH